MRCEVRYMGPSFPQFHGVQCELPAPHEGFRHRAIVRGGPLSWWEKDEKEIIRDRKKEPKTP